MDAASTSANRRGRAQPTTVDLEWSKALDVLPGGLDLSRLKNQPALSARLEVLVGKRTDARAWDALDDGVKREIAERLAEAGISPTELAIPRRGRKPRVEAAANDGFDGQLGLGWTKLAEELPFNLYYNTVNPSYLRVALREQLSEVIEKLGDRSLLELEEWPDLPDPVRRALIYQRIRFHLDPNGATPITRDEWRAMKPEHRKETLELLQASGFGLAHFQRPGRIERHAGRQVKNVAPGASGAGDDRNHELTSATSSLANIVTAVASRPLSEGKKAEFDVERDKVVEEAQKYLVTRYYGFERQDYVNRLVAAAERGVRVEVEMHPPETASHRSAQQAALNALQAARKSNPKVKKNLSVSTSVILPHDPEKQFPQIMHEKSVIADTPRGTLVELEGGINGGGNSPNNLDFAMRVEGTAVLDALRKYLSYRSKEHTPGESVAEAIIKAYPAAELEKKVAALAKRTKQPLTRVDLGGGGQRQVPAPETYRPKELKERAKAGLSINLDIHDVARFSHLTEQKQAPKWVLDDQLAETLTTALENGSSVTLTVPRADDAIDAAHYDAIKEATTQLRRLGALVTWDDTVIRDASYQNLVYASLDQAIERKESCDVAAFALTDLGMMERLVKLHRSLLEVPEKERPPLRVAVHDLEIEDQSVNQKVVALTTAGLDVRVFTDLDAVRIAGKLSEQLGRRISASDVKLHAKGMLLGKSAAKDAVDPRVAHGSANFSASGFEKNVEGGRFYHRPELVDDLSTRVFEEIFSSCRPVDRLDVVPLGDRAPLFSRVPLDTPIEKLAFLAYDLETTGFAAHFGEVPVSMGAILQKLEKKEKKDGTVTWSRAKKPLGELDAKCRLGMNAFGNEQKVPKKPAEIHGFTREKLKHEPPLMAALERFAALARATGDAVVPMAHNAKFDAPFLDFQYSRPQSHIGDVNLQVIDQPMVCTMELAREVLPFTPKEDRAEGEERQSYKLTKLAQQLCGREQSEVHDALEDVDISLDVLVALANQQQARTLRDLLPRDRLFLEAPGTSFELYGSAGGKTKVARFENVTDARVQTLLGRNLRDGEAMMGAPKRIYDHEVIGAEKGRVQVRFRTTSGEREESVSGWVDAKDVRFYQGGQIYWGLRQDGHRLKPPRQMSRGELWRENVESGAHERLVERAGKPRKRKAPEGVSPARLRAQLAAETDRLARVSVRAQDGRAEALELAKLAQRAEAIASEASAAQRAAEDRIQRLSASLEDAGGATR